MTKHTVRCIYSFNCKKKKSFFKQKKEICVNYSPFKIQLKEKINRIEI